MFVLLVSAFQGVEDKSDWPPWATGAVFLFFVGAAFYSWSKN